MKQMLVVLALCLTVVASCIKEQAALRSIDSATASKVTSTDDFYLSKNLKPFFRRIDSANTVTVFSDSVYNTFGGNISRLQFQFSNPNIDYRHLKLTITNTTSGQYSIHTAATTTTNNGVKELVFDNLGTDIFISPGWSNLVLKAKVFGNSKDSFHVTIPQDGITYYTINGSPGTVVGLPLSTSGLAIR